MRPQRERASGSTLAASHPSRPRRTTGHGPAVGWVEPLRGEGYPGRALRGPPFLKVGGYGRQVVGQAFPVVGQTFLSATASRQAGMPAPPPLNSTPPAIPQNVSVSKGP